MANTSVKIYYQAVHWSKFFMGNVACDIRESRNNQDQGDWTRYILQPNHYSFITLQADVQYEIVFGVIAWLLNFLIFTVRIKITLHENETKSFVYKPPDYSFRGPELIIE